MLKEYSWEDIYPIMQNTSPVLAEIIQDLSPSRGYSLYICDYPYGALILNKGVFQLINENNEIVPLTHKSINNEIQENLSYTGTIPVGMVIDNSIETFFISNNLIMPSSFYTKGGLVSLWSVLENPNSFQIGSLWSITSGARTVCMLPKITDKHCYEELKRKYDLKEQVPQSLIEHWKIFERIANHKEFSQPWKSKILFFSKKWFEHKNDKKWAQFYQFILNTAWNDSAIKRNQFILDFAFSLAQRKCGLKPNPYLADTIRHLVSIGLGGVPGLKPATDNIAAPIAGLQKAFIEDYRIKKLPNIMQPHHLSGSSKENIYYSFEMPTTTTFSPRSSNGVSRMVDMRELKYLLDTLFTEIVNPNLMVEKTPLFRLARTVNYTFYHTDRDKHNEITQVKDMSDIDHNFKKLLYVNADNNLIFSEFSPFFKGCVSMSISN